MQLRATAGEVGFAPKRTNDKVVARRWLGLEAVARREQHKLRQRKSSAVFERQLLYDARMTDLKGALRAAVNRGRIIWNACLGKRKRQGQGR